MYKQNTVEQDISCGETGPDGIIAGTTRSYIGNSFNYVYTCSTCHKYALHIIYMTLEI